MDGSGKWFLCKLGDCWYGLDLSYVQEINYRPSLLRLPSLRKTVAGVMDWMDHEVTVVDFTGTDGTPNGGKCQRPVVILKAGDSFLGLMADEIGEIISEAQSIALDMDSVLLSSVKSIKGAFQYRGEMIFTLEPMELYKAIA
jgi:chemotaxis signal transduction protein